jgi:hypothetical protein
MLLRVCHAGKTGRGLIATDQEIGLYGNDWSKGVRHENDAQPIGQS